MKTDAKVQALVDGYGNWVQREGENTAGSTARMTRDLYPYDSMFSPIKINRTTIKNRIVMAPMGNIDMCEETGRPNDKMLQYFFARAKGGTGLLTTGLIPISHGIDHSITELGKLSYFPRIDRSRTVLSGWRDLAQGVHAYGSKIFVQLTPGLGRVGNPQCLINEFKFPVSASFNPNFYMSAVPCVRLSDRKLKKIIKNAGQATADAVTCGLDGVYLHGHEGYLLEQLTNPAFNRRVLGRYANWQRFGIDMVKEMRRRVGANYPIMYRIDLSLAFNETYGEDGMKEKALHKFKNGRSIAETLDYMENLVKAGVDLFDVDLGCYDNWWLPHPPAGMPAGCFLQVSQIVKEHFKEKKIRSNAGVEVPVVGVGKLGYPDIAEKALRDGACDMVMLGRPLLADAEWCNKAYAGEVDRICPCIGCQEGCINEFVEGGHPQCAVNPRTGFEDVIPENMVDAKKTKKIGVVGAGPAGITFAINAAQRGHQVELLERSNVIGGKVIPGSIPKIKYDFNNYLIYLENQVKEAEKLSTFTVKYGTEAATDWLKNQDYDAIVFAYGTENASPKLPGIEKIKTVQAVDLLADASLLGKAKKVVIVGGGVVGCETAYWLKYEHGCEVKVVEMLPNFMEGACTANRGHLIHYMHKAGVELINCAKVTSFEAGKVNINRNISKGVPNPYNTWQPILPKNIENPLAKKLGKETKDETLEAELVVLAMGGRADDTMYFKAQKEHTAPELYNIGDSLTPGRVLEATRAAYQLASRI
jgi:2-enoate reductase